MPIADLANASWKVILLNIVCEPSMGKTRVELLLKVSELDGQDCANTAFAFSTVHACGHMPLLDAVSVQSATICTTIADQSLQALVDVFSQCQRRCSGSVV